MSDTRTAAKPFWRKHFLAILLVGGVLCLGLAFTASWVLRDSSPEYSARLATGAQQERSLTLPDGTEIVADGDTDLTVGLFPRRRDVNLIKGQAYFKVVYKYRVNTNVRMGMNEVNVLASRLATPDVIFDVDKRDGVLVVRVAQGELRVRTQSAGPREFVELRAGQAVRVDIKKMQHEITQIDPSTVGDWR